MEWIESFQTICSRNSKRLGVPALFANKVGVFDSPFPGDTFSKRVVLNVFIQDFWKEGLFLLTLESTWDLLVSVVQMAVSLSKQVHLLKV